MANGIFRTLDSQPLLSRAFRRRTAATFSVIIIGANNVTATSERADDAITSSRRASLLQTTLWSGECYIRLLSRWWWVDQNNNNIRPLSIWHVDTDFR